MILTNGTALDFAPQALGEWAPIASATGYFYAEQGVPLLNTFALYGEMYRSQPWVATVVDKVANSAARLSFNSWDHSGGGEKVLDTTSAYAQLWRRPCPTMHRYGFWRWTMSTYEVYGEAFWVKIRRGNAVIGFYPMHPSRTVVKRLTPQEQTDLGYDTNVQYVFSLGVASAGLLRLPESDVVPFLRYNPDNLMRGLSRVEPLRSTLYNEDASRRAIESWWKRGARPSLMISAPAALSDKAYARLEETVSKVHGGADQMGGTIVLEEGAKPVPVQLSAEEMQYIQARALNRGEVCAVYDIPPPVVHILDHATFCLPADALVSTERGPVPICDVTVADRVWSLTDDGLRTRVVLASHQTGFKPLLTIRTQNRTLECTDNHPLMVRRTVRVKRVGSRGAAYRHDHVWVPAGDLHVGDVVVTAGAFPEHGGETCPTRTVSEGFAEFVGLLLGDGGVTSQHGQPVGVTIARAQNANYMDHYRQVMVAEFSARDGSIHLQEQDRMTRFNSVSAARELLALGLGGVARTKRVPEWVFGLSDKLRLAVLRGFLDADGSCDKRGRLAYSSVNGDMLAQMRMLCIGLGVPVTNLRRQDGFTTLPNGRRHAVAQWNFTCSDPGANLRIGSHDGRYLERMNSGAPFGTYYTYAPHGRVALLPPADCGYAKVVRIDRGDVPVPVYDIEVDGSHNFIANGLIVHNSNITEQMRSMYRDTMTPRLEDVESVIEHHVQPDFGDSGLQGAFALDEVLRGDFETRATAVATLIERGVMKPSEARPLFDLDDAGPVADKLYASATLQELGRPAERVTITAAVPATPEQVGLAQEAAADAATADAVPDQTVQRTLSRNQRLAAERRGRLHKVEE